jgi:FKBP-type peptidyl-prolyl cis-trans isomerase SlyD
VSETELVVKDGLMVGLDYTLRGDDGEIIDTSTGGGPLEFVQGHGEIIPGLEQALYGMGIGDEKDVVVAPVDGYGDRDPEADQLVPLGTFPADMSLKPGMGLRMRDDSGRVVVAFVADIRPDGVLLDFNHPLAGKTLHFHVRIAGLRQATGKDLAPSCGPCPGCASEECAD